jgi:hypothetical protein
MDGEWVGGWIGGWVNIDHTPQKAVLVE